VVTHDRVIYFSTSKSNLLNEELNYNSYITETKPIQFTGCYSTYLMLTLIILSQLKMRSLRFYLGLIQTDRQSKLNERA
jgi:hypothetical protein